MPQLDPASFAPQLVWLAISFIILYVLLSIYALPKLGNILEARKNRIADDLEKAAHMRDEAEKALAEYEATLKQARQEAQAIVQQARTAAAAKLEQEEAKLKARLADNMRDADTRLEQARQTALANINETACAVSGAIIEAALGTKPAPDLIAEAVAAESAAHAKIKGAQGAQE